MPTPTCPHCGVAVPADLDEVCTSCGKKLPRTIHPPTDVRGPDNPEGATPPPDPGIQLDREFHEKLRDLQRSVPVTRLLVALNVLVFAIMVASGVGAFHPDVQSLLNWGANYGPDSTAGQFWRLLTGAFLHAGIAHLLFNMLFLAGIGTVVERMVGSAGFLLLYLSSAVVASLTSIVWSPAIVSVGASGAVFAVFGAFFGATLKLQGSMPVASLNHVRKRMFIFLVLNLLGGLFVPRIDMAAHVGGLVWGFVCGLILGHPLLPEAIRTRPRRNLSLLLWIAIVVGAAFALAHMRVADLNEMVTEVDRIEQIETIALSSYNDALEAHDAGQLTDSEFADMIEQKVLPKWGEGRERARHIATLPGIGEEFARQLLNYFQLRKDAWELMVQGIRSADPDLLRRARELTTQANAIQRNLAGARSGP